MVSPVKQQLNSHSAQRGIIGIPLTKCRARINFLKFPSSARFVVVGGECRGMNKFLNEMSLDKDEDDKSQKNAELSLSGGCF